MMMLLALACRAPDPAPSPPATSSPSDTSAVPDPAGFSSPAEAVDLDPADGVVHVRLVADEATLQIAGIPVDGYAYDGQVPGPTIRATLGDTLIVELENHLDEPTTIHWHGLRVPFAMDGVTWQTDPVAPGSTFTYTFPLLQAGTFWYHPHFDSARQVDLGLYGVLVVEDPADPPADVEIVAVLDGWDEARRHTGEGETHGPSGLLDWTVNGEVLPTLPAGAGTTIRARFVNVANTGYADVRAPGRVIARDQGLLAEPEADRLLLGPGDRGDLEWTVSDGFDVTLAPYTLNGGAALGDELPLLHVAVDAPGAAPEPLPFAFSGLSPSADPGVADVVWVFQGDTDAWFINGEQFPDVTIPEVALGDDVVIEVRNLSSTEHPFHLHGLVFEVLSVDGIPPAWRTIEDTINVPIRSTVRLAVHADNPGDWMAHCHLLPHAHDMMTILRVSP